ncbi:MAG: hypothetical protein Q8811_02865, partial [Candidatus Phytoplasma australasiaticum]|nr:hypothetical protein [Candidatus Phytoplasma australasiaticum]
MGHISRDCRMKDPNPQAHGAPNVQGGQGQPRGGKPQETIISMLFMEDKMWWRLPTWLPVCYKC